MSKETFKYIVRLASQPLPKAEDKSVKSGNYTDTQTRSRKAEDISVKPNDTSHLKTASTETKNPQ